MPSSSMPCVFCVLLVMTTIMKLFQFFLDAVTAFKNVISRMLQRFTGNSCCVKSTRYVFILTSRQSSEHYSCTTWDVRITESTRRQTQAVIETRWVECATTRHEETGHMEQTHYSSNSLCLYMKATRFCGLRCCNRGKRVWMRKTFMARWGKRIDQQLLLIISMLWFQGHKCQPFVQQRQFLHCGIWIHETSDVGSL